MGKVEKKVVMASGVFDILHPGHVFYLSEAKKLGDELIVVIARDSTVIKRKGRAPIFPEEIRRYMVSMLKPVDRAVLGKEGDMYEIVEEIRPSIIALGYDQDFKEEEIKEELRKRGIEVEVVRLPKYPGDLASTRKILKKIREGCERVQHF